MVERVMNFIPSLKPEYFSRRGTAGIRTPVISPDGNFIPDVMEREGDNSFHIVNYNSPGATGFLIPDGIPGLCRKLPLLSRGGLPD